MEQLPALDGVRVLELSDEKGAYCGKLLADMGAEVVKIEPPGGDPTRRIGPFHGGHPDPERSLFFWHYNAGKRSAVLDLSAASDRERFRQLAAAADVLLETLPPGTMERWQLSFEELRALNPRLVFASLTAFGQSGPRAHWRTSDTVAQAVGGMLFVNGFPDEPPLRGFGLQAYHTASAYTAIAILLALLHRERTGRGQRIDASVQECVICAVEHVTGWYRQSGRIAERRGSLHWTRYFRVGKCRDGYILHCALGDWTSLVEWVKADGEAQDLDRPEWEDYRYRRDHCEHLFDVLDQWVAHRSVAEIVEGAQLRRIPYAAVAPLEEVPRHPQLQGREFFVEVFHEDIAARIRYPGAPYRFSATPWRIRSRPPHLGEHTAEVLAEAERTRRARPLAAPSPVEGERRVLEGIRVADFTWVVAGPVATRILADHGADVIKIERPDSLDFGTRRGGLTGNLNRGKRSIVLDMNDPRGLSIARRLIATADVVVDNFSPRVMANWGLTFEELRKLRPDIIALSMSGFGHTGPHRDYVSYGPTLQALAGYTYMMRLPGREPAGWGYSYADMAAGYTGALAVLLALWHRQRTGRGQFIDLSQFESAVALLGPGLLGVLNGQSVEPRGNESPEAAAAPHGVYRCADRRAERGNRSRADRWCAIAAFGEEDWQRLVAAMGSPPWAGEERFRTLAARLEHRKDLDALVEAWTRERDAWQVMELLQAAGVPAGVVADAEDLCARDEHLRARGFWARAVSPEGEVLEFDGVPFRLSETPGRVAGPGPMLGEHTDAVLAELGFSRQEIAQLRSEGVVA